MIQKTIWAEIARLDTAIVTIALDELVRAATDGGIGSRRCEIMADTLIVLSSISVRGKILSKLRKVWFYSHYCFLSRAYLLGHWENHTSTNEDSDRKCSMERSGRNHAPGTLCRL